MNNIFLKKIEYNDNDLEITVINGKFYHRIIIRKDSFLLFTNGELSDVKSGLNYINGKLVEKFKIPTYSS